ncbi:MAG: phage tail protein [Isosphaeraceae bacterium]
MTEDLTVVELEGVNGEWFTLAGADAGDRRCYLATGVKGLFDPPVKTVYEEPGNYPGARFLNHRILRRDITLAILIVNEKNDPWSGNDSELRKALAYDRDAKIHVTTQDSGTRTLKVRLGEAPDVDFDIDPHLGEITVVKLLLVAADPFWYEEDVVYSAVTQADTRFQPTLFGPPWPWASLPSEDLSITVNPLNPTDQYIWLKWAVPASQERVPEFPWPFPPGIAIPWDRAPFTQWVIPDYSFEDPSQANRRIQLPGLIIGEDSIVDTDPRVEQISSASGSQVWARTNGVRFRYPVPPYTQSKTFNLSVAGCAPGQMVTLRIPRPWSRPWGLE